MFSNLAAHSHEVKKLIYFGSGAEYDKSRNLHLVEESEIGISIPQTGYGKFKLALNEFSRKSDNIYNYRLFGTLNPYERPQKNVVCNLMAKAVKGQPLNLKRDCIFSFVDVDDVIEFIDYGLRNELKFHDYNLTSGISYRLSDIASLIRDMVNPDLEISFEEEGLNKEYSGSDSRWKKEFPYRTPINESLEKIYIYIKGIADSIDLSDIDGRWHNTDPLGKSDVKDAKIRIR